MKNKRRLRFDYIIALEKIITDDTDHKTKNILLIRAKNKLNEDTELIDKLWGENNS